MRSALVTLLLLSPVLHTQTVEQKPLFEAASIKMTDLKNGSGHAHEHDAPGLLRGSMTLKGFIMAAYGVQKFQVTGGPDWVDESTYEIVAKLENGGSEKMVHLALQSLLGDRFQLKFHRETKDLPAYALTVAKGGSKLKEVPGTGGCGTNSSGNGARVKFTATCVNMANFAANLGRHTDRPISDQTHLPGFYSFTLEWTPDDLKNAASADQPALPSIFTAIQDQLGLKLESQKAPVDLIVIDSAERPTEN